MRAAAVAPPATVLAVVRWFLERYGYAPTVREIAVELDVAASTVQVALDQLERDGMITRGPHRGRTIRLTEGPTDGG